MFSIDLVTFFYSTQIVFTVRQHTKNLSLCELLRMKTVCVCAIMTMCGLLKKMMWREPDDELIWILRRRSNRKNITSYVYYVLFQMLFLSKRKNISVIDMYSMKLNVKEYLWHWIWHACMTCFIRWLHFGKANIIHNLYVYMWFVMQISSKFARFRKQKRDSQVKDRRCISFFLT